VASEPQKRTAARRWVMAVLMLAAVVVAAGVLFHTLGADEGRAAQQSAVEIGPQPEPIDSMTVQLNEDGLELELVWIPPGEFMMGSPESEASRGSDEAQHHVRLTHGFWMGKCEVTQEQWEAVTGKNPSYLRGDMQMPVDNIGYEECQVFLGGLAERHPGGTFRLPTEAEWEYACRAGTATPFAFGETISSAQANYNGNAVYGNGTHGRNRKSSIPVGSLYANAWGLYDMHGNVWEFCEDSYGKRYYDRSPEVDPANAEETGMLVLRGGSWRLPPLLCRSATRSRHPRDATRCDGGLRVVFVPEEESASETTE